MLKLDIERLVSEVRKPQAYRTVGKLRSATGVLLSSSLPAAVGDQCEITASADCKILAEVIGFGKDTSFIVPYEHGPELRPGMTVTRHRHGLSAPVGPGLLGRTVDGLGRPLDGQPLNNCPWRPVKHVAPRALDRSRITKPFVTGQRALDGLLSFGQGQRVGIFAGSGVGKSTLLGEIAKNSNADVNVIALIGERGREVRPFLEDCIGPQGLQKSVVVLATCDQTPLMRVRAVQVAVTMADYFRETGANVLFLLDSLTRLAMAQRELGLAMGEPPSARGYTPSVFQLLAETVERLGNASQGSITGIMTVLVDGGDLDEPISDAVRSLVDGHVVLDRKLAERGQYPAISISRSVSRIAHEVTDAAHQAAARKVRAALAAYEESEDLIRIGAYVKGTSPQVDRAVELRPRILAFLKQEINEKSSWEETSKGLHTLAAAWPF